MEVPELFQDTTSYYRNQQFTPERRPSDLKSGLDHFIIEDLLDFSNEDDNLPVGDATFDTLTGNSTDSSTVTVVDSCNSSVSGFKPHLSADINSRSLPVGELWVPYDDLAELEWLSNLVEESFSSEDMQKLKLISGVKTRPEEVSESVELQPEQDQNTTNHHQVFTPDMSVPGKARSKRSRTAGCNWSSRLLALSPSPTTSSSESDIVSNPAKKSIKAPMKKKKKKKDGYEGDPTGDGRKCLHCATDKTPQWRTGPLGPKTLCNACGVRYKSGRLVPEYRPAASPTFVLTQHSNSHRKVLELRRQKEMQSSHVNQHHHHHHQQYPQSNNMYNVSKNNDNYLIHQHIGPDFSQLI